MEFCFIRPYLIKIFVLLICVFVMKIKTKCDNRNAEDNYLLKKNKKSWIVVNIGYDSLPSKKEIDCKLDVLNNWYLSLYKFKLKILVTNNQTSNFPNPNYDICIFMISNNMHCAFDHVFIGGQTITKLVTILIGSEVDIKLPESNSVYAVLNLPKYLALKPYQKKSVLNHTDSLELKRYRWEITTPKEGSKYLIIYEICKRIHKCYNCPDDVEIVIYLPIAFVNDNKNQFNNIGLVWLTFAPSVIKDYKSIQSILKKKQYEAVVTNALLKHHLIPKGGSKKARSNVDAVISMSYGTSPVNNIMWSYYNKPDYPLYLGVATNKLPGSNTLKTYITFTVNTGLFIPSNDFKSVTCNNGLLVEE